MTDVTLAIWSCVGLMWLYNGYRNLSLIRLKKELAEMEKRHQERMALLDEHMIATVKAQRGRMPGVQRTQ